VSINTGKLGENQNKNSRKIWKIPLQEGEMEFHDSFVKKGIAKSICRS
jgi:hypothetical protein